MAGRSVRDWLLQTVPDPARMDSPSVVEDAGGEREVDHHHQHPGVAEAFNAPDQDSQVERQHGGPGSEHAVPVMPTGSVKTQPLGAERWNANVLNVPDNVGGVGGLPGVIQVVGRDPWRRGISLQNVGIQTIYVSPRREGCVIGQCWPIASGQVLNLDTKGAVYATSVSGGGGSQLAYVMTMDDNE